MTARMVWAELNHLRSALADAANDAQALRLVLGNLVDALMDESANITDQLPEVVTHLRAACDALGGSYLPYLDHWALVIGRDTTQENG